MSDAPDRRPLVAYVEDDDDTFRLAELRLRHKYRLIRASDDREACAVFREHGAALHAILMDVELAGSLLDGVGLVRLLRGSLAVPPPDYALNVPVLETPIVLLTAYITRYSEADARAIGATHFATKPIDFTRLTLALAQISIRSVLRGLASSPTPVPAPEPVLAAVPSAVVVTRTR